MNYLLWRQVVVAALLVAICHQSALATATFSEIKASYKPSDTLILDRHGELLHRLRTDASVRRGQWVALADVSPALRTALVLSEDKRFYEHSGVDWQAVSAAAWANLWNSKTRGASTITMQLAGLLDEDLKRDSGGRSVVQKLGQTVSAQLLERGWRKDQILEAYLNLVPFRGELVGIDALSQPGSTLKPFLYAQALAEKRLTAASLLEDSGTQIQTSGGLYIPQNYETTQQQLSEAGADVLSGASARGTAILDAPCRTYTPKVM